ncbi:MAG: hypothetical protein WBL28_01215 [Methylotenera sp.]
MSKGHWLLKAFKTIGFALILGVSLSACGAGKSSWKEEVLLHDGSKIVAERTVVYGGRHEIGQKPGYKEQSLTFTMPGTNQTITWEDHYSEDLGGANFLPMALDISSGVAYLVVKPMGTISFSKWGCPNPPYVIFKYINKTWLRISIQDLPAEIKMPNLIGSQPDVEVERIGKRFVSAEWIKVFNAEYKQPEYRTILREPVASIIKGCLEPMKGGGWQSPGGPSAPEPITPSNTR